LRFRFTAEPSHFPRTADGIVVVSGHASSISSSFLEHYPEADRRYHNKEQEQRLALSLLERISIDKALKQEQLFLLKGGDVWHTLAKAYPIVAWIFLASTKKRRKGQQQYADGDEEPKV
jgi:hypothetical protein